MTDSEPSAGITHRAASVAIPDITPNSGEGWGCGGHDVTNFKVNTGVAEVDLRNPLLPRQAKGPETRNI